MSRSFADSSGAQAMLYGGIVIFAGWMLYGLVAPRFQVGEAPGAETLVPDRALTHARSPAERRVEPWRDLHTRDQLIR